MEWFCSCFNVSRGNVTVPEQLTSMIWPELDQYIGQFGRLDGQVMDLCASGFTNLLVALRNIILQDSVFLQKEFPNHPVWAHPVFQTEAYATFAREVNTIQSSSVSELSLSALVRQAVPELVEHLDLLAKAMADRDAEIKNLNARLQAQQQCHCEQTLKRLLGGATFRMQLPSDPAEAPSPHSDPNVAAVTEMSSTSTSSVTAATAVALPSTPSVATLVPASEQERDDTYRMSRDVKTVSMLWKEWTEGLNGGPAVRMLEERHGHRWRKGRRAEQQWFSSRKRIIDLIHSRAASLHASADVVVLDLEQRCQNKGWSVDKLSRELQKCANGWPF